jgi:hypothetical protein
MTCGWYVMLWAMVGKRGQTIDYVTPAFSVVASSVAT